MWRDSILRRAISICLGLSFLIQISGCSSWRAQQNPPGQVLAQKSYKHIRINLVNGGRIDVYQPRVEGDSLFGYRQAPPTTPEDRTAVPGPENQVQMALSDIQSVELRRGDTGKTLILVGGITLVLVIAAAAASSSWGDWGGGGGGDMNFSCPLIYSWDGQQWRLDSGTFGGAIMPALQRTDLDNLIYAVPSNGNLRLRLANELRETDYVDALSILAVDHPPDVAVLPDAGGSPRLHGLIAPRVPLAATDQAGRNQLPRVGVSDGIFWESDLRPRDPANPADATDGLELSFRRPADAETAILVLDARNTPWAAFLMGHLVRSWGRDVSRWYDPTTSALVARELAPILANEGFLTVQVKVNGRWETQGRVWESGPEVTKRVAMPLDLSGVTGDQVEVRLQSIPNFWMVDYAALGVAAHSTFSVNELPLTRAVDTGGQDVRSPLAAEDGRYLVMPTGHSAELAVTVPPVPAGMVRSYLARSTGWYRIEGAEAAEPNVALLEAVGKPGGPTAVAIRLADSLLATWK